MSKFTASSVAERIGNFIAAYPGDGAIKAGLGKVARSKRACEALAQIGFTDAKFDVFIGSMAEAVSIKLHFPDLLKQERAALKHSQRWKNAVAELRGFLRDIVEQPQDRIRAVVHVSEREYSLHRQSLHQIEQLIRARERIARETPVRIGATRKSSIPVAAQNAAIGWLVLSVKKLTGKPWIQQSCILAEVLLGIGEVDEEQLKRALKNTKKQWRLP